MTQQDFRRLSSIVLQSVIFFTVFGLITQHHAFVRGLWVSLVWQVASVACFAAATQFLKPPYTRWRTALCVALLVVKFGALYWLGYKALLLFAPSAVGLATGLTLPWAVVVTRALWMVIKEALPIRQGVSR